MGAPTFSRHQLHYRYDWGGLVHIWTVVQMFTPEIGISFSIFVYQKGDIVKDPHEKRAPLCPKCTRGGVGVGHVGVGSDRVGWVMYS